MCFNLAAPATKMFAGFTYPLRNLKIWFEDLTLIFFVCQVIPPTQEEIEKDAKEEKEGEEKSPSKAKKSKKSFSPAEHLFKYELEETDPDEGEVSQVHL